VTGTVADGSFGPDLTHLMSRETIASGAAPNTPENLRLWIQNPDAIKPGSKMPAMGLSDQELDAVTHIWRRCAERVEENTWSRLIPSQRLGPT